MNDCSSSMLSGSGAPSSVAKSKDTLEVGLATVAALPMATCVVELDGTIRFANEAWLGQYHVAGDGDTGVVWLSRIAPLDRQRFVAQIETCRQSGKSQSVQFDIGYGASARPVEVLMSWHDDLAGAIVVFRDRSAEKDLAAECESARQVLDVTRGQLEQVFLAATDALVLVDCETLSIVDANPAAGRLYGYVPEHLRERSMRDLAAEAQSSDNPIRDRSGRLPLRVHRRRDGSHFPVEIFARYFQREGREVAVLSIADVTSRTQQERALLESELKYRAVFDAAPYPIILLSARGTILDVNASATRLYRYSREEMVGIGVARLIGNERNIDDLLQSRQAFIPATTHIRGDGSTFLAETTVSFARVGDQLMVLAVVRDITAERQTLERLKEAEERWRFALEGAGDGVWDWNLATNDFYQSPRWREMLGYPSNASELFWSKLLHPDDKQQVYGNLDAYLYGDASLYQAEFRLRCADGSYKWIAARGKIMSRDGHGQPMRMLGTHRDITESRRMMETLRASEQRWQFALEGHGDGLWDWSLQTGAIALTSQFKQILGYGPDDALENAFDWVEQTHPDDRKRVRDGFEALLAGHDAQLALETRLRCADGSYKWVALRGKVMEFGALNRPIRMIGTLRDIADIKRREEHERNEQEQLAHAGRLITLGEMASALAHELNQPLTAIRNFSALGLRRLGDHPPEGVRDTLEIIAGQSMRAGEIVRRIRNFVRKGETAFGQVQVNAVVSDMARFAAMDALAAGVQVVLELDDELPPIIGDRVSLEQLVMNLIKNGIEAMESVDSERRLTVCTAKRADGSIECSVTDLGVGLSPEVLAGLFQPFVTTKSDGVGLGLAICRTIVENHGGRLWVEPTQGRGASFHFAVPIAGKERDG